MDEPAGWVRAAFVRQPERLLTVRVGETFRVSLRDTIDRDRAVVDGAGTQLVSLDANRSSGISNTSRGSPLYPPFGPMTAPAPITWRSAWLDALAFSGGLAVAWWRNWQTTDLVWSLWLSSLVVGYTILVWHISQPMRQLIAGASEEAVPAHSPWVRSAGLLATLGGSLFMLAFFTVHFGGFHLGHSVFLHQFFPVADVDPRAGGFPGWAVYAEVVRRYWVFVPVAFLAERAAFRPEIVADRDNIAESVRSGVPRRRHAANGKALFAPYKNVVRMHLLIFFFAAVHALKLDHFAVYAAVYAVYFFPWHLLRARRERRRAAEALRQERSAPP